MKKKYKKKILIVVDTLMTGGAARQISLLSKYIIKKDIRVHVFFYKHKSSEIFYKDLLIDKSIRIHCLSKPKVKEGFSVMVILEILKIINKESFDCLLSFQLIPSQYLFLASIFCSKKVKKIFSLRNSPYSNNNLDYIKIIFLSFFFDNLIVNSFIFKDFLCRKYKFLKNHFSKKTKVILNGYETFIQYDPVKNTGIPKNFLVLSRIHPVKGGIKFAKAIKYFLERNDQEIKIKWAGNLEENNICYEEYCAMNNIINSSEKLKKNWNWIEHSSDIETLYNWADIVLIPSNSEGMSNVMCEAMCRSKFIISSKVGDFKFMLGNSKGIVSFDNSHESFCFAIEQCLSLTSEERKKICKNAYKFAKDKLIIKSTVEAYLDLFI